MQWYRHGNPEGRYIGFTNSYDVYENVISERKHRSDTDNTGMQLPEETTFNYGPSTGGLVESVNFKIHTPGELITSVQVNSHFKRRSLNFSGKDIDTALMLVERINGFHSSSNAICFLRAIEDATGVDVPQHVNMKRIICIEMERIRSHLTVIERLCSDASFGVPHNRIAILREEISRLIGQSTGHRYMFGIHGVGSISADFSGIPEKLLSIVSEFRDLHETLLQSKIFLNRLQGNGNTMDEWMVGPAARSSGKRYDARVDSSSLPYSPLNFQPIVRIDGDAFGRFMVRSEEIFSSIGLIERALDQASGVSQEKLPEKHENGEGGARIESPQGDLFYYVSLKNGLIERLEIASPSVCNVNSFRKSIRGNILTDFPFNWDSFGIWISEMEVNIR